MENTATIAVIRLGLAGNLGAVPEDIAVVKVFSVVLILLTSFHFVQILCISGKALETCICLFRSHHVLRLQRRCLGADLQRVHNAGIL